MIDHFEFGRVEMSQDISPHETAHSVLEYRDIIGVTLYKAYALEIKHFCPPPLSSCISEYQTPRMPGRDGEMLNVYVTLFHSSRKPGERHNKIIE